MHKRNCVALNSYIRKEESLKSMILISTLKDKEKNNKY